MQTQQTTDSSPSTETTSSSAASFYRTTPPLDPRIYILGVGNVGRFIAHALRGLARPPPVTLLFATNKHIRLWNESAKRIAIHTDGDVEYRDGFDVELAAPRVRVHGKEVAREPHRDEGDAPISTLIVANKSPSVLQHLSAVKHRLHADSVVCFLQNGMGLLEKVDKDIFPDPSTRPYYMVGINSHGIKAVPNDRFASHHAGYGTLSLSIMPHERERAAAPYEPMPPFRPHPKRDSEPEPTPTPSPVASSQPNSTPATPHMTANQRYLLRMLLRPPVLSATGFSPQDLLQIQLEKLAINCVINPLTVLLDARNGALLYNYALSRTMRLLLAEISVVFRSLPELSHMPNLAQRFDPGRLETLVVGVAHRTSDNVSSMLADVRYGRQTEIEYLNGYVVRRGEELGIRCVTNFLMCQLVKGKQNMVALEMGESVPLENEGGRESELKILERISEKAETIGETDEVAKTEKVEDVEPPVKVDKE